MGGYSETEELDFPVVFCQETNMTCTTLDDDDGDGDGGDGDDDAVYLYCDSTQLLCKCYYEETIRFTRFTWKPCNYLQKWLEDAVMLKLE